jgi:hypothetical protein
MLNIVTQGTVGYIFFFSVALRLNTDHALLIVEVFLDHTQRRTTVGRTPLDE